VTLEETLALITYANQLDPRVELTTETAKVWRDLIGDLDLPAANDAMRTHYRQTANRVMPADIRRLVNGQPDAGRQARKHGCPRCSGMHGTDPCIVLITKSEWEQRMGYTFRDAVADTIDEIRAERAAGYR
jgi:hypothetical protein